MANIIQIKRSATAGVVPTAAQLQEGELAINLADLILYVKNSSGAIVDISGSNFARLLDPEFIGTPKAPTPSAGDNSTKIATTAYVRGEVDKAITGLDFQKDVLAKQVDATLDPSSSPTVGDRYIITDSTTLHVNFGIIGDVEINDIVEFDGTEFQVVYDVSSQGEGALVWDQNSNSWQRYDGTTWERFGGLSGVTGGAGITVAGDAVSIDGDDVTIHTNASDKVAVKSSNTAGQSLISQGADDAVWGATPLDNPNAVSGLLPFNRGGVGTDLTAFAVGTMMRINATQNGVEAAQEGVDFLGNNSLVDGGTF